MRGRPKRPDSERATMPDAGGTDLRVKRLLRLDWDAVAGIIAAVGALVLELFHVVEPTVVLAVVLVVLALLLFRDLRRETREERLLELVQHTSGLMASYRAALSLPEAVLVGPGQLRSESERFASEAHGPVTYFNVCLLMFKPQPLFDKLLRPAIENTRVASIQFILDEGERERWRADVLPKVRATSHPDKVLEPRWCRLLQEGVSFILAEDAEGRTQALLSFWGEPFMAKMVDQQVPRYVFWVHGHSDLVSRLSEMERQHRLAG
jgi:hypothetical protein